MDRLRSLARLLADERAFFAWEGTERDQHELWNTAVDEGVEQMLAARLRLDSGHRWSAGSRLAARETLARAAVLDMLQHRELRRVVSAFAAASVPLLVLKGAAWAVTVYSSPETRPRRDTDLMIAPSCRELAHDALLGLGYEAAAENVMQMASAQRHYTRIDDFALAHHVDLHWRAANPLVFADVLPFSRLWDRSVAVEALGGAHALCAPDALLFACLHRVAHHGEASGLLWLLDVHWLAVRLTGGEWDEVVQSATGTPLARVCARSLARASDWLGTPVPAPVGAWMTGLAADGGDETFAGRGVNPLHVFVSDWRATAVWRDRLRLVTDHLLPPPSYMFARYATDHAGLLPLLYARRAIGGLYRWIVYGR